MLRQLRPSASCIVLSKNQNAAAKKFNYDSLLFVRPAKSTFMPESTVFPGGVCDASDSSPAWLKHFQRYDITAEKLQNTFNASPLGAKILPNDDKDAIATSISLRITAIRETFEEMGLLLCRDRKTLTTPHDYAQFYEQFDREHWQREVHNDPSKFLELCSKLDVVPDLWSLHEWSAWVTPSTFKKRFITAFFLAALQTKPTLLPEIHEVKEFAWRTPDSYLQSARRKELWLPPPQYYELSRFLNFRSLEELVHFAQKRAPNGVVITHPVQYKCTDGIVHLLPGDDLYPTDPDACNKAMETGLSVAEFRAKASKLHRSEHWSPHDSGLVTDFQSADGHLNPLDIRG